MVIYKLSQQIPVTIGKITFWVSPLSYGQKIEIQSCIKMQAGQEQVDGYLGAVKLLKFSVKRVDGLTLSNGDTYEIALDDSGCLSDDSLSEIMQLMECPKLIQTASLLLSEIKEHKIPGVKIDLSGVVDSKKKVV